MLLLFAIIVYEFALQNDFADEQKIKKEMNCSLHLIRMHKQGPVYWCLILTLQPNK